MKNYANNFRRLFCSCVGVALSASSTFAEINSADDNEILYSASLSDESLSINTSQISCLYDAMATTVPYDTVTHDNGDNYIDFRGGYHTAQTAQTLTHIFIDQERRIMEYDLSVPNGRDDLPFFILNKYDFKTGLTVTVTNANEFTSSDQEQKIFNQYQDAVLHCLTPGM